MKEEVNQTVTFTQKKPLKFTDPSFVEVREVGGDKKEHEASVGLALRDLNRQMKKSEILNTLRRKEHFVKPSVAKRLKRVEAARRSRMESRTK